MNSLRPDAQLLDHEPDAESFLEEVYDGLAMSPKTLPCKYFYDQRGSQLFDRICVLDEYYLTRTELEIMQRFTGDMANEIGPGTMLAEYGSGSSIKTRHLLDHLESPAAYVPVDISRQHLQETCRDLAQSYPALEVLPVCADFTSEFELATPTIEPSHCTVYFPGSTIGNFPPSAARQLLRQIADHCGVGGRLLIGIDLQKDRETLEAAYNDAAGVTAEFNLNLLRRINHELAGNFPIDRFEHRAIYNSEKGRIEMYLVSLEAQQVSVSGQPFSFSAGELICTEHSHKYTVEGFSEMATGVGLVLQRQWTDDQSRFAVLLFTLQPADDRS